MNEEFSYKLRTTYQYDHVFTRGLEVKDVMYDWKWKNTFCKKEKEDGYIPDHAILRAEIKSK